MRKAGHPVVPGLAHWLGGNRGSLVAPGDPFLQVRRLGADRRRIAVTGPHHGVRRERQQPAPDGLDDGGEVAVGPAGGAGAALEQGVAAEDGALAGQGRSTWSRGSGPGCAAPEAGRRRRRTCRRPRSRGPVRCPGTPVPRASSPRGCRYDRGVDALAEFADGGDVVIVAVGEQDGRDGPAGDGCLDGARRRGPGRSRRIRRRCPRSRRCCRRPRCRRRARTCPR